MLLKNYKPGFDMPREADQDLRPSNEKASAKRFDKGLPESFHNGCSPSSAHFINEYKDGKQFLGLQDVYKIKYTVIRQLQQ